MIIDKTQFAEAIQKAVDLCKETNRLLVISMNGDRNIQQIGHLNNAQEAYQDGLVALKSAQSEGR